MIMSTGGLGTRGHSLRGQARTHKTFEVEPHSARQARISAHYHGKIVDQMNPSQRRDNSVRYPQTGLGG